MNEYEAYDVLLKHLCKEISSIVSEIQKKQSMSAQELEHLDKLYHLKKSMLACRGMEHPEEFEGESRSTEDGYSGRRGRSSVTGRYVSRAEEPARDYADGYSEGYSEAMYQMNGGNSGHYPMIPPRYQRR